MAPLERVESCPKRMIHGPCGGVTSGGHCEVEPLRCPFVDRLAGPNRPVRWTRTRLRPRPSRLGRYLIDFRPSHDGSVSDRALDILGGRATILIGDHVDDPPELRAPRVAPRLVARGARVVATVTARNRTREECAEAINRLVDSGVEAVHCVTGDHPAARLRSAPPARFHADSLELTAMARSLGAHVSVAESPSSPPTWYRLERLADKIAAGADLAILNHLGSSRRVRRFVAAARERVGDAAIVAPVPVITDHASMDALAAFPGLVLDPDLTEAVSTSADPRVAGIASAAALAALLLESTCPTVNLSGSAGDVDLVERCRIMEEIIEQTDERLDA